MMDLRQYFIDSVYQSATIILSAFVGGFAGNFLANNPGPFERSGATIGLLFLLVLTVFLIKLMLRPANDEPTDAEPIIVCNYNQNVEIMQGNGEIVEVEFIEASVLNSDLSSKKIGEEIGKLTDN